MVEAGVSAVVRAAERTVAIAMAVLALAGAGVVVGAVLGATEGVYRIGYVLGGVLVLTLALLRREAFLVLFLGALVVIEEFPTTLVHDRRFDRSLTYLYGKSLGIPGLYGSDLLLLLGLVLYTGAAVLHRRGPPVRRDPIFLPLAATAVCILLSVGVSLFVFPDTATPGAYRLSELPFSMKASVAPLIPYFQFKTWLYVYASFLLWRFALHDPALLRRVLGSMFAMLVLVVGIGVYRYVAYRDRLGPLSPLYYDDATIFFLTVMTCFFLLAWGERLFSRPVMVAQAVLMGLSVIITVLSIRRANLLGLALCLAVVLMLVPAWFRWRVAALVVVAGLAGLLVMLVGGGYVQVWEARGSVSAEMRSSTLYRWALFVNLLKGTHLTLLGYGARPLWNERLVLGSFQLNFENVHSIYYWFLLRTGVLGLGAFLLTMGSAAVEAIRLGRAARRPGYRALAHGVLVALVLYLFVGVFHPVYAMARFTMALGFLLALLMALREENGRLRAEGSMA